MATTTNYSWSTPDDTALVKDGAAAIRSLGTAIDSTVFTNAGAAVTKATVDAKGDLIAGTADNTIARLAVGANDTVLTADSSTATGLKWSAPAVGGGMTLLSTTTLSGASTTISSISQSYKNLYIVGRGLNQGGNASYYFRLNGNDTAADYSGQQLFCSVGGSPAVDFVNSNNGDFGQLGTRTSWNGQGYFTMTINRYTETENKIISSEFRTQLVSSPDIPRSYLTLTAFNSTTAISSIKFVAGSGSHDGTIYIYGVN
jgi:hypothetical protein